MFAFYNREFSAGLRSLELLRSEFKLDLFLSSHVDNLFEKIRSESIKQVRYVRKVGKFALNFHELPARYSLF